MELEPEEELLELSRALRAHAEWQIACGAEGLPRSTTSLSSAPVTEELEAFRPSSPQPRSSRDVTPVSAASTRGAPPAASVRERPSASPDAPGRRPSNSPLPAPSSPGPIPEAPRHLEVLAQEVAQCTSCALHATRKQTVFARGKGSSGLCFVGEGPGADEDEQGLPFVGKAGQLLDRMIAAMGLERDEVYVCNIVKCRPPNNRKPQPEEIAACVHYVERQIEIINPEVIVALGATAVEGLFGSSVGITRLRGRFKLYKGRIAVMPTFHPAYLLRNPAAKRDVWDDLQKVLHHMGREVPQRRGSRGPS